LNTTTLESPFGELTLQRRPRRRNEVLQAWDAADRYLLNYLAENPPPKGSRLLLVNDAFGCLAAALSDYECISWSDSAVAHRACLENCAANQRNAPALLSSCEAPTGSFDRIIYRLPRNHSYLRYQLQHIAQLLRSPDVFIGACMAKYLDSSSMAVFSESIGEAAASLAWKKARLIHLQSLSPGAAVDDDSLALDSSELGISLNNRANVFSRGKLDRGSRLLLNALGDLHTPYSLADLGCGNGLLGIMAGKRWPETALHFFDESYMAIDSARHNVRDNLPGAAAQFYARDCMHGYDGAPFDTIVCNPPFHQEQQLGDHIARQMFSDSHAHLAPGGQFCVVGNRHLDYHKLLKKRFGNCEVLRSDAKFVVLLAQKTQG
jgi:16S rRNA (guanine1207-N2)-methyltransferase